MKMLLKMLLTLSMMEFVLMTPVSAQSEKIERVIWNKQPISVALGVGHERMIEFPSEVRFWMPDGMERMATILSTGGVLYISARRPFPTTRVRVQNLENQTVYLIDLFASVESGEYPKIVVTDKDFVETTPSMDSVTPKQGDRYVDLTRHAALSLYAPERLMPTSNVIRRLRINNRDSVPLVRGGAIEAIPVDAWKGFGLYVTAVRLRNLSSAPIEIVISSQGHSSKNLANRLSLSRDIRGAWLSLVPHHDTLGSVNSETDRTTLYVVSSRSFIESLRGGL